MFRMKKTEILFVTIVIALVVTASTGCGGGSSSSSTRPAMSQAQAQAMAAAFSTATSSALQGSFGASASESNGGRAGLSSVLRDLPVTQSTGCTQTASGETCTFPVSSDNSQPCTGGGTIAVSGNIAGTINNNGSGSLQAQLTLIPQDCSVDGVIVEGAPSVTGTSQINLVDSAPVYPITVLENGDISFGAGACPVSLTYTSTASGCTMSGNACGEPISGTC